MEDQHHYLQDFFQQQPVQQPGGVDQSILESLIEGSSVIAGGSSFFWLLDYCKPAPAFVSSAVKEVLGYHPSFLNRGSMGDFLKLVHAEDRAVLRKVYADIYEYYQRIPVEEKGLYRFDFNYRVQRADYRLISVMQQTMFVQTSAAGVPLIELSLLTDFSTYKTNPVIQLHIFKEQEGSYEKVAFYQYDEHLEKLTEREKEVLELIAQGLTDKETADRMSISLHTVKTHRKNILTKMDARNTAEAVNKYLAATAE